MPLERVRHADWGDAVEDVQNSAGSPLYRRVDLNWTRPTEWRKDQRVPAFDDSEPFLYALVRNHPNSKTKDHIAYIGLTESPKTRFGNHKTAKAIVSQAGSVGFSYAKLDSIRGRNKLDRIHYALEEIEHLLIWAVPPEDLWNQKKQYTLPGMGSNGGNAWHVVNGGYRVSGRMPKEIVFPWMLVRPGRNLTAKRKASD
jgi:hypothetical protein